MAELLLELFSEEIPARMQARAAEELKRLVLDGLAANGLAGSARAFATPRRLALVVQDVPTAQADLREERRGPRVARAMRGPRVVPNLTCSEGRPSMTPRILLSVIVCGLAAPAPRKRGGTNET